MTLSTDLQTLMNQPHSPAIQAGIDHHKQNDSFQRFIDAFFDQQGFDPLGVYCIATGQEIGATKPTQIASLLTDDNCTDDSLIEDIAVRILASMRPSIHWNVLREETIDEMRKTSPVETLAYLMNRLIAPEDFRKFPISERLDSYRDRIMMFQMLADWHETSPAEVVKAVHMLIEVDAKVGLDKLPQPFTAQDFMIHENPASLLFPWYTAQIKKHNEQVRLAEQTERWYKSGNPLAKRAFNSVSDETRLPSKEKIKKQAKIKESRLFENILDELTGAKPAPKESKIEAADPKRIVLPTVRLGKIKLNVGGKQ